MQASDQPEFLRLMASLGSLYGKPMDKPLVEMYWGALQRFELSEVKQALQAHIHHPDTGKYMPKPSEVVCQLQGTGQTQSLQAWSKVSEAIRGVGGYESVVFDDAVIHAVIRDMGGWIRLCQVLNSELPFRGRDFEARYAGYVGHPPAEYPRQLIGMLAHQNGLPEPSMDTLVCIGDKQKALAVYAQGQTTARQAHPKLFEIENKTPCSPLTPTSTENTL
jgi:hypothetical protein